MILRPRLFNTLSNNIVTHNASRTVVYLKIDSTNQRIEWIQEFSILLNRYEPRLDDRITLTFFCSSIETIALRAKLTLTRPCDIKVDYITVDMYSPQDLSTPLPILLGHYSWGEGEQTMRYLNDVNLYECDTSIRANAESYLDFVFDAIYNLGMKVCAEYDRIEQGIFENILCMGLNLWATEPSDKVVVVNKNELAFKL